MLQNDLLQYYGKYMYLKIYVDDLHLKETYLEAVSQHHVKMTRDLRHADAGFDLFAPSEQETEVSIHTIDFKVVCSAQIVCTSLKYNTGFYLYPRSSISRTHLRLANQVGIIDAGYRGHLIGVFDVLYSAPIKARDRYVQIVSPYMCPIVVEVVSSLEELGCETVRGLGGFGSTGV